MATVSLIYCTGISTFYNKLLHQVYFVVGNSSKRVQDWSDRLQQFRKLNKAQRVNTAQTKASSRALEQKLTSAVTLTPGSFGTC